MAQLSLPKGKCSEQRHSFSPAAGTRSGAISRRPVAYRHSNQIARSNVPETKKKRDADALGNESNTLTREVPKRLPWTLLLTSFFFLHIYFRRVSSKTRCNQGRKTTEKEPSGSRATKQIPVANFLRPYTVDR